MRAPSSRNWDGFPERDSLALFAQVLLDSLFDHTTDSFKAPALGVHSLALELRTMAADAVANKVSDGAIAPVLEELQDRLGACPVLAEHAGGTLSAYRVALTPKSNSAEILATTRALTAELAGSYWERIKKKIVATIEAADTGKIVVDLAHAFICEAELRGYTREDIYLRTKSFFFKPSRRRKISSAGDVKSFLAQFSGERRKYAVTFLGNDVFLGMEEFLRPMGITIERFQVVDAESPEAKIVASGFPVAINVKSVSAFDVGKALRTADYSIQFAVDIQKFFHHRKGPQWHPLGLVKEIETGKMQRVRPATSPVYRGGDAQGGYVDVKEQDFIGVFSGRIFARSAVTQIYTVLQYHRAALDASTPENQLLDLWAAVEGFLPVPGKDTARISHFISHILPCLTLSYPIKLFSYIDVALRAHLKDEVRLIDDSFPESDVSLVRTAAVLISEDLAAQRQQVLDRCADNPLLIMRAKKVAGMFSSLGATQKSIERHRKWVSWQIQRIYSSRNRIAHSASRLPHLESLVENLHSYVDLMIRSVIRVGSQVNGGDVSIETVMKIMKLHEVGYMQDLKGKDFKCNSKNFMCAVFGAANPLSPEGGLVLGRDDK
ncbi:hypothetical protein LL963_02410 [Xanthomonas campestris pv. esculenti]|nr:hypothetical protein [Xanthomonas campestris pv. esculenti]